MKNNRRVKSLSLRSIFRLYLRHFTLAILTTIVLSGCNSGGGGGDAVGAGGEEAVASVDIGKVEPLDPAKVVTDPETGQEVVNDQVLIIFKDSVSEGQVKAKISSINGEIVGYLNDLNDYQIRINGNPSLDQLKAIVDQLNNDPDVEAAILNHISGTSRIPDTGNDPQWFAGIDDIWNESDPRGRNWGLEAIYAPSAWGFNDSMSIVKLGVVDGGFNSAHEDLVFKSVSGSGNRGYAVVQDFKNKPSTCGNLGDLLPAITPEDQLLHANNHGTHVAGTIGAKSNNSMGITGVVWKHEMFGWRTDFQSYDIKAGVMWNLVNGAKVINLSLGTYIKKDLCRDPKTSDEKKFIDEPRRYWTTFMQKLVDKNYNFLVVQAAGNEGVDARWSGLFNSINDVELRKRIITVGAVEINFFDWLPYGKQYAMAGIPFSWETNYGEMVDVVAPGQDIYSAIFYEWGNVFNPPAPYKEMSGTSMAAPHVTGVAGLVWAANPYLTAAQVKNIVVGTADRPITGKGSASRPTPYPILNAKRAVERALSQQATNPIQQPSFGGLIGKVQDAEKTQDAGNLCQNLDVDIGDPCPIEDASVVVFKNGAYNASTVSMSDGSYELLLEAGTYTVTVGRDGYIPENIIVTATEGAVYSIPDLQLATIKPSITDGATDVSINSSITVTFGKALDATTITTSTFVLSSPSGLVAGTVAYNAATNTATFTPSAALAYNTTYTATITTGVTDMAGNPLVSNYSWSFTTVSNSSSNSKIWGAAQLIENFEGISDDPQVAIDGNGNATAVWQQLGADAFSSEFGVGTNRTISEQGWGTAQLVPGFGPLTYGPKVAVDKTDSVLVVARENPLGFVIDTNITAVRYVFGQGWSQPQAFTAGPIGGSQAAMQMNDSGVAWVGWTKYDSKTAWVNLYSPGSGWGTSQLIGPTYSGSTSPKVAIDDAGNGVVLWEQSDAAQISAIYARYYDATQGWQAAQKLSTGQPLFSSSKVVLDAQGNAIAVWEQSVSNIYTSRYTRGEGWSIPQTLGSGRDPDIAVDINGNAFAIWGTGSSPDTRRVWAVHYTPGQEWSAPQVIITGAADEPRIAMNGIGDAVVLCWQPLNSFPDKTLKANYYSAGQGWGVEQVIASSSELTYAPDVTMNENGNVAAVWRQTDAGSLTTSIWAIGLQD